MTSPTISIRFSCSANVRRSKLRTKALVEKLPKSRRYRLCPPGYSICLVFLKLFERIYAPLAAGLLQPYRADSKLKIHKQTQLDRLYQKVIDDLDELVVPSASKLPESTRTKFPLCYAFSRTTRRKSGPFRGSN
jgi:hypothetical protein